MERVMHKKVISIILALSMLASVAAASSFAEAGAQDELLLLDWQDTTGGGAVVDGPADGPAAEGPVDTVLTSFGEISTLAAQVFYVAPDGSADGEGTIDSPLTLIAARDKLRTITPKPEGGITVYLLGGEYGFTSTLNFTAQDSGTADCPIVYTAYPGQDVSFTGAVPIPGGAFTAVTDPAILARLHPDVADRGVVMQADLNALGIPSSRWGSITRSNPNTANNPETAFYVNNVKQQISRWPDDGFALTGPIVTPQSGSTGAEFRYYQVATLNYAPDRWTAAVDQAWASGYWYWDWYNDSSPVTANTVNRTLKLAYNTQHNIAASKRYFVFNLLEEINLPGEWFLDRGTGILYYYPSTGDLPGSVIKLASFESAFIDISNTSYLTIEGITLEASAGRAFNISNANNVKVAGCTVRNLGGLAASISNSTNTGFLSNDFYDLARGGLNFTGSGVKNSITPSGNYVINNYFSRFNLVSRTYSPAIETSTRCVGVKIENNIIHDGPHSGILIRGVDNEYRYNELYDLVYESDDAGAIYGGRNWTDVNLQFDNNLFHDIFAMPGHKDAYAIYIDDNMGREVVTSNIFYNVGIPFFGHGSFGNLVDGNVFVDCVTPVSLIDYNWNQSNQNTMISSYDSVGMNNQIWKDRFDPDWTAIGERLNSMSPRGTGSDAFLNSSRNNVVTNNISVSSGAFNIVGTAIPTITNQNNVTADAGIFRDAANKDYTLETIPAGLGTGFTAPAYASMGLFADAYRDDIFVLNDFSLVYPYKDSVNVRLHEFRLMWNHAIGATYYDVTLAKDAEFTNIVLPTTRTKSTYISVPDLESMTKYYWKVEAVSIANKNQVLKLNAGGVYSFTTEEYAGANTEALEGWIISAKARLAEAVVGPAIGEYPQRDYNR